MSDPAIALVRLGIDERELAVLGARAGTGEDPGYTLHLVLRRLLGEHGLQPFRLLDDASTRARHGHAQLLGYTAWPERVIDLVDRARESVPGAAARASEPWGPALGRVFLPDPVFRVLPSGSEWNRAGELDFEVLVRPIRRSSTRADLPSPTRKRGAELDAYQYDRLLQGEGATTITRETVYARWLADRLGDAAHLIAPPKLEAFRLTRSIRSTHGKGRARPAIGPEALMRGRLRIGDIDAFEHRLRRGVGRHAAFGFGMLLLSRAA